MSDKGEKVNAKCTGKKDPSNPSQEDMTKYSLHKKTQIARKAVQSTVGKEYTRHPSSFLDEETKGRQYSKPLSLKTQLARELLPATEPYERRAPPVVQEGSSEQPKRTTRQPINQLSLQARFARKTLILPDTKVTCATGDDANARLKKEPAADYGGLKRCFMPQTMMTRSQGQAQVWSNPYNAPQNEANPSNINMSGLLPEQNPGPSYTYLSSVESPDRKQFLKDLPPRFQRYSYFRRTRDTEETTDQN